MTRLVIAPKVVITARKSRVGEAAAKLGHSLGAWGRGRTEYAAHCYTCGAWAAVQLRDGSISGPALTARCKTPETAGRAA